MASVAATAVTAQPAWFALFLADRGTRKPSPHTLKAYRQDFAAIAALLVDDAETVADLPVSALTKQAMRVAFAKYAQAHEPVSIRRCWSTWNVICTYLYTAGLISSNPMPLVGRPKVPKTLPKSLAQDAVAALLAAIEHDEGSARSSDWAERDRAIVLTALLAGLRSGELVDANVGDIRVSENGGVIDVRGKGGKDRRVPIEQALVDVLDRYLVTRRIRFPEAVGLLDGPREGIQDPVPARDGCRRRRSD